jgi:hypothetical protein
VASRGGPQIPLDDEPVDIDLGDLPTDEELEAAAAAGAGGMEDDSASFGGGGSARDYPEEPPGALALFQLWVVLVVVLYTLTGLGIGLVMAFRGAAHLGFAAMKDPSFYLVVFFWPIAIWQLFWNQF